MRPILGVVKLPKLYEYFGLVVFFTRWIDCFVLNRRVKAQIINRKLK